MPGLTIGWNAADMQPIPESAAAGYACKVACSTFACGAHNAWWKGRPSNLTAVLLRGLAAVVRCSPAALVLSQSRRLPPEQ